MGGYFARLDSYIAYITITAESCHNKVNAKQTENGNELPHITFSKILSSWKVEIVVLRIALTQRGPVPYA